MRIIKSPTRTIKLEEKYYEMLLKRFDTAKIQYIKSSEYRIYQPCMCGYLKDCWTCMFDVRFVYMPGCLLCMEELGLRYNSLIFHMESIELVDFEEGKVQIQAIRDYLLSLPKE